MHDNGEVTFLFVRLLNDHQHPNQRPKCTVYHVPATRMQSELVCIRFRPILIKIQLKFFSHKVFIIIISFERHTHILEYFFRMRKAVCFWFSLAVLWKMKQQKNASKINC